jgi:hypothetical protein
MGTEIVAKEQNTGTAACSITSDADHRIELLPIGQIAPYQGNARTHSKEQVGQIAESIKRFGFNNPVLIDENGVIVAGHGRVAAAKLLGLKKVPALRLSHLSPAEKKAYILADNKLAENAGWNKENLAIELQELVDLNFEVELTGYETGEIAIILDNADAAQRETAGRQNKALESRPSPHVSKAGDVWVMGNHRVLRDVGKPLRGSGDSPNAKYAVGYRRPPLHSRFKPGQSGNLKGRPAGRPNVKSMVERVIHQKLPVRQGEKTREMPMLEAMIHAHAVKAVKGDARSAGLVLNLLPKAGIFLDQDVQSHEQNRISLSPSGNSRPSRELFENVDLMLLSDDEKIELSRLAEIVDLGGGMTALSISDFGHVREIVNKGRGKDITRAA